MTFPKDETIPAMWNVSEFNSFRSKYNSMMTHYKDELSEEYIKKGKEALQDYLVLHHARQDSRINEVMEVLHSARLKDVTQEGIRKFVESWEPFSGKEFRQDKNLSQDTPVILINKKSMWKELTKKISQDNEFRRTYIGLGEDPLEDSVKEFKNTVLRGWAHKPDYAFRRLLSEKGFNRKFRNHKVTDNFLLFW
jgi:hypothetical protein